MPQLPLGMPWSVLLASLSNIACFYLGVRLERRRNRQRAAENFKQRAANWQAVLRLAEQAWDDWDQREVERELNANECQFTCPKCGCHEWGSDITHGSCHNEAGCDFIWHRTDDAKYFR